MSPKNVTNSSASGSPRRIEPSARYSIFWRDSSRIVRSISSTAAGWQASASSVAAMASSAEEKWPTAIARCRGLGTSCTVASTTVTSVPSDPTTNVARSRPPDLVSRSSR